MRTVKLFAAVLMLTLAAAVYDAGAMQDATKPRQGAEAEKNCCRKHPDSLPESHAAANYNSQGCCKEGCCGEACAKAHEATWADAGQATAADVKSGCCLADSSCSANGGCCKSHKNTRAQAASHVRGSCCKEGADCCKRAGNTCCKAHKSDAAQSAGADTKIMTASCACCGNKQQAGGR